MSELDRKRKYDPVEIIIYNRKRNLKIKEISLIAIKKENQKVLATGNDAASFISCEDNDVFVLSPLRHGVIADYTLAQVMFQSMLQKASVTNKILKPKIAVCVPEDITELEKKAFEDVFYQSGARNVLLIEEESIDEINLALPSSYSVLIEIVQNRKKEQMRQEIWKEVGNNKIPAGVYQFVSIRNEEQGTVITLNSSTDCIQFQFLKVIAIRMIEEKAIPNNLYSEDAIEKFGKDEFRNKIYQIENGEFDILIKEKIEGMNYNHYMIMSESSRIEVLSEQEPNVITWKLKAD